MNVLIENGSIDLENFETETRGLLVDLILSGTEKVLGKIVSETIKICLEQNGVNVEPLAMYGEGTSTDPLMLTLSFDGLLPDDKPTGEAAPFGLFDLRSVFNEAVRSFCKSEGEVELEGHARATEAADALIALGNDIKTMLSTLDIN